MAGYEGTWYRKEFEAGYSPKDRRWPQGNGYEKDMVPKKRKGQISPIDQTEPKVKLIISPKNKKEWSISPNKRYW